MCGVPHHAIDQYVSRLVERGLQVAICEQVEDPRTAKGMVRREVVRVVTPGTVTDPERLDPGASNFLAAVRRGRGRRVRRRADRPLDRQASCWRGPPTAASWATCWRGTRCAKCCSPTRSAGRWSRSCRRSARRRPLVTALAAERFRPGPGPAARARGARRDDSLDGFGCPDDARRVPAAAAGLRPPAATQRVRPAHLTGCRSTPRGGSCCSTPRRGATSSWSRTCATAHAPRTLLETVDRDADADGRAACRAWLLAPLRRPRARSTRRHALVEELRRAQRVRRGLVEALARVRDLERLLGRAALGERDAARPAGAARLAGGAARAAGARCRSCRPRRRPRLAARIDPLDDLAADCSPPRWPTTPPRCRARAASSGRGLRRRARRAARELARGGKQLVAALETRERERTGIASLKVGYNQVFGYYIEVTRRATSRASRRTTSGARPSPTPSATRRPSSPSSRPGSSAPRSGSRRARTSCSRRCAARSRRGPRRLRETARPRPASSTRWPASPRRRRSTATTRPAVDREDRIELEESAATRWSSAARRRPASCPTTAGSTPRSGSSLSPAPTWPASRPSCGRSR